MVIVSTPDISITTAGCVVVVVVVAIAGIFLVQVATRHWSEAAGHRLSWHGSGIMNAVCKSGIYPIHCSEDLQAAHWLAASVVRVREDRMARRNSFHGHGHGFKKMTVVGGVLPGVASAVR